MSRDYLLTTCQDDPLQAGKCQGVLVAVERRCNLC